MNLNELLNFRTANKFVLTEDFESTNKLFLYNTTSDLRTGKVCLPKGLVFTIVGINLNNVSQTMRCKIIRATPIVKNIYEPAGIDPKFYTPIRWNGEPDKNSYVNFILTGEDLFYFLNTVKADQFTSEYKKITEQNKS